MNYQIYTMYVNRKDLLLHAIHSIEAYMDKVVVLDNSLDQNLQLEGFTGEIFRPVVPLFCAQSYNLILSLAIQRKQEVFFMMHSDAQASNAVVRKVLDQAKALNRQKVRWGILFTCSDVLCLFNTELVKDFKWDPYLPLYYTDVDYYRRLRLAGIELMETHLPVEHLEGGSTCMKADLALRTFIQTNYPGWRMYYRLKWGGERDQERFTAPFNGDDSVG